MAGVEVDAEFGEGVTRVGHNSFAAGFVDGRAEGVGEEDVCSSLAEGDGCGEAGGACSDDEYVTAVVTHCSPRRIARRGRRREVKRCGRPQFGGDEAGLSRNGSEGCRKKVLLDRSGEWSLLTGGRQGSLLLAVG
jgi:hypothetical protein